MTASAKTGAATGAATLGSGAPRPPEEGESERRLHLIIVHHDGDWGAFADLEVSLARAGDALARHPDCRFPRHREASVVLASDALLAHLNRTYRGKEGATNVLSFPFQRPAGAADEGYLGDVVLAAETVHGEAVGRGIAPVAHLQHLVVHGLLHLVGHDHCSDGEAEAMEALETAILAAIGLPDPHGASP